MHERSLKPVQDIHLSMTGHLLDYRELTIYTNKLKRENNKLSLFRRISKGTQSKKDMSDSSKEAMRLKHTMFMSVVQVPRLNPKCSVCLEFEAMQNFSESDIMLFHAEIMA